MEILVLAPFKERHMDLIRQAAGEGAHVVQLEADMTTPVGFKKLREAIDVAEVIIGEPPVRLLGGEDSPTKWVQSTWSGVDAYTSASVKFPEGIMLTNAAGAYGHTISQFVVGQILAIAQNTGIYAKNQATVGWRSLGPVMSLEGARVMIYGAGDIGRQVAKRLVGFDVASITGVCRNTDTPREGFDELVTLSRAEFLLPQIDVVVCCMPDTGKTVRYFGERRLLLIKEGGILVNVGRGNFVDCEALARVLDAGHLRGAALDVTDPEPLPVKHALWRNERCLITPHAAGGAFGKSDKTEDLIAEITCENLRRYVAGQELTHRVL